MRYKFLTIISAVSVLAVAACGSQAGNIPPAPSARHTQTVPVQGDGDGTLGASPSPSPPPTIANVFSRGSDCDMVCNAWNGNYAVDPFGTLAGKFPVGDGGGVWTGQPPFSAWCAHTGNPDTDPLIGNDPQLRSLMTALFNLGFQPTIQSTTSLPPGQAARYDQPTNTVLWDPNNVRDAVTLDGQQANQILFHELVHDYINFEIGFLPQTTQTMQVGSYSVSYDLSKSEATPGKVCKFGDRVVV